VRFDGSAAAAVDYYERQMLRIPHTPVTSDA
jgi:hypothetical protein